MERLPPGPGGGFQQWEGRGSLKAPALTAFKFIITHCAPFFYYNHHRSWQLGNGEHHAASPLQQLGRAAAGSEERRRDAR